MADLTTEQTVTLNWMGGFRAFFDGKPMPAAGIKRTGWLAAKRTVLEPAPSSGGGYGSG